jgi:hypothetical protein
LGGTVPNGSPDHHCAVSAPRIGPRAAEEEGRGRRTGEKGLEGESSDAISGARARVGGESDPSSHKVKTLALV